MDNKWEASWIPTSERYPDDKQAVLAQDRTGFITRLTYDADLEPDGIHDPAWFDDHEEFFTIKDIVAWMPLPPKYEP